MEPRSATVRIECGAPTWSVPTVAPTSDAIIRRGEQLMVTLSPTAQAKLSELLAGREDPE